MNMMWNFVCGTGTENDKTIDISWDNPIYLL